MEWIQAIMQWAKSVLEQTGFRPVALPIAFIFGLFSALASACCTLPMLGAIVAYSGTREDGNRKERFLAACFFMLGTTIALVILGVVAGFIGQIAQDILGKYWKIFAGLAAIFLGLAALKLLPFQGTSKTVPNKPSAKSFPTAAIFGLVMGGGISVASLCCNAGIFIILGVAVLEGHTLWAMGLITVYALGFSLPLAAIMLGVSWGKSVITAKKAETIIRSVAGVLLILVGFYFLATF